MLVAAMAAYLAPNGSEAAKPHRFAWSGLERGPLAPAKARALEALLVDELDGYDSFRLVDASGFPLDRRLLASEAALVSKLKDEGVDLFLRFKHRSALKKLEQAINIFESRLVTLEDYELLHDTLLAKAEAQYQSGERGAAKATLKNLLALGPSRGPTTKTHPAKFVALWESAKREIGATGRIAVECADPGCLIQVDGQPLGEAPLLATRIRPGKHYVVARWPHGVLVTTVRVAPGKEARVRLSRTGPAEEARRDLLTVVTRRKGSSETTGPAAKVASLARAKSIVVGAVKKERGKPWLYLARHSKKGQVLAVGRVPLLGQIDSANVAKNVKRLCAALFVDDRRGEFTIDSTGASTNEPGLADALYAHASAAPPPPPVGPAPPYDGSDPPPPPPPGGDITDIVAPPPETGGGDDGEDLLSAWWFWAIVGGVAAAGATTAVVVLSSGSANTTEFQVRLP